MRMSDWSSDVCSSDLNAERSGGAGAGHAPAAATRRRLAPDLVELAEKRGLADDPATRQLIARAHTSDWLQGQLLKRIGAGLMTGGLNPAAVSLVKLRTGLHDPERAAIAMEIAGRTGIDR